MSVSLVKLPGRRVSPSVSVNPYWNSISFGTPVTTNSPLYPDLAPGVLVVDVHQ